MTNGGYIIVNVNNNSPIKVREEIDKYMTEQVELIGTAEILGKEIKFYNSWENPLFLGKDVAEWVGYSKRSNGTYDVSRMLETVDEDEKLVRIAYASGQGRKMWFLTEKGVKQTLANSRKISAKETLKLVDDDYGYRKNPKQTQFEIMLKNAIDAHLNRSKLDWNFCPFNDEERCLLSYRNAVTYETEVKVGNYRLDFYFKNFNLVVEYDENHHKYQKENDEIRQQNIINILGEDATFIRVKEGEEFEGVIKIISYLVHYAFVF